MKKDKTLLVRMDKKLYRQLSDYSKRNDNGLVSVMARRALTKFLAEEALINAEKAS